MIEMDALKIWTTLLTAVAAATLTVLAALGTAPAASAASLDNGASFSVRCDFSHRASDDPIAHLGHPGASHSHDFFGNRSTSAHSGYRSMLAAGTTCSRNSDRAAYWMPTMSWNGQTIKSDRAVFYYRAGGKDHKKVKPFPAGLKIITNPGSHIKWRCGREQDTNTPPRRCSKSITTSPGPELGVRFIFPDCSNGKLDSYNHRAHMAYSKLIDGEIRCPSSHPISVPVLTMNVTFPLPTSQGPVWLSSGRPSTVHADFFNTWNQGELTRWVSRCINNVSPSQPRPTECKKLGR
jgi:Domain of unknown function (DUF1996)